MLSVREIQFGNRRYGGERLHNSGNDHQRFKKSKPSHVPFGTQYSHHAFPRFALQQFDSGTDGTDCSSFAHLTTLENVAVPWPQFYVQPGGEHFITVTGVARIRESIYQAPGLPTN